MWPIPGKQNKKYDKSYGDYWAENVQDVNHGFFHSQKEIVGLLTFSFEAKDFFAVEA